MSGIDLSTLAENAQRLGQRLQESLTERTRDLPFASSLASTSSSAGYFDTGDDKLKLIAAQLDPSAPDRDKLSALRRLLALISTGRDPAARAFFAAVVKNVGAPHPEVRRLVYIYLLRFADAEPDLALLSINTFTRDLSDASPLIRAMALRVLAGLRVPSVSALVLLSLTKAARDPSPHVRKHAAFALPKLATLDVSHVPELLPILAALLRDRAPAVLGAAASSFSALAPDNLELLHPVYRRLCAAAVDADEWGQPALLDLLIRYARTMLPRPSEHDVDPDLELLLGAAVPLLGARNPAVVVAAARTLWLCAPRERVGVVVGPLLRLLDGGPEVERVVLEYILCIAQAEPDLFAPHWQRFIVLSNDSPPVKLAKIALLQACARGGAAAPGMHAALLREFVEYAADHDPAAASASVHALGALARVAPDTAQPVLAALTRLLDAPAPHAVAAAVLVLKSLVDAQGAGLIVETLAARLPGIAQPAARACVLWLVGQHAQEQGGAGVARWAPDALRLGVRGFKDAAPAEKLQVLTLAAKLAVLDPDSAPVAALARHAFALARYDAAWDVRDRARLLSALVGGAVPSLEAKSAPASWDEADEMGLAAPRTRGGVVLRREQVRAVLLAGKAPPAPPAAPPRAEGEFGRAGLVLRRDMRAPPLPEWEERGVDALLRADAAAEAAAAPAPAPGGGMQGFGGGSGGGGMQGFGNGGVVPKGRGKGGLAPAGPVVLVPAAETGGEGAGKAAYQDLDTFYASESEEEVEEEEDGEEEEEEEEEGEAEDGVEDSGDEEEESEEDESEDEGDAHQQLLAR